MVPEAEGAPTCCNQRETVSQYFLTDLQVVMAGHLTFVNDRQWAEARVGFDWRASQCGDLWNLLPAYREVNSKKSDRLPSADTLKSAHERIFIWCESGHNPNSNAATGDRFFSEAKSGLPLLYSVDVPSLEAANRTRDSHLTWPQFWPQFYILQEISDLRRDIMVEQEPHGI